MNEDEELNVIAIFYDGWGQGKNLCEALAKYKSLNGHTKAQIAKAVASGQARIYITNALTGGKFNHCTTVPKFIPPAGKWAIMLGTDTCEAYAIKM